MSEEIRNHNVLCSELLRTIEDCYRAVPDEKTAASKIVSCYLQGMMNGVTMMRDKIQREKDFQTSQAKMSQ